MPDRGFVLLELMIAMLTRLFETGAAHAAEEAAAEAQQGGLPAMAFPLILFGVIFYFLILRPQKKQKKQQEDMLNSISRGDVVMTAGGFYGRVTDVLDDSYILEIADGVRVRIRKISISLKLEGEAAAKMLDRPRRKKRRRRPDGAAHEAPSAEGVTAEENEALLDASEPAEGEAAEAEQPDKKDGEAAE